MKDKLVYMVVGVLIIVALFGISMRVEGQANAGTFAPAGQCTEGIDYQQLVVFKSNSTDVNEYLTYLNQIHGCDVHVSVANDSPGQFGYFIWFKESYLTTK